MSFIFDITGTPPAQTDIATKREQAVDERAVYRKKNIRFMIGMATVTSLYLAFIFIFIWPMLEKPQTGIIFYFFPHVTFIIFIVGNDLHIKNIEKPSKLLDKTIAELSEATAEEINDVIDSIEQSAETISSYMEKVSAQGRSLIHAELNAIQEMYEKNN